jgi:hypothetical protein
MPPKFSAPDSKLLTLGAKLRLIGLFVCLLVLGLPAVAQALSNIRYHPDPLYTDDPISITWTANRDLKKGYVYKAAINIISDERGCTKKGEGYGGAVKKGKTERIELLKNLYPVGANEWCAGRVEIEIGDARPPRYIQCRKEEERESKEEIEENEKKSKEYEEIEKRENEDKKKEEEGEKSWKEYEEKIGGSANIASLPVCGLDSVGELEEITYPFHHIYDGEFRIDYKP